MRQLHAGVDRRRLATLTVIVGSCMLSPSARATSTYYIDECTNYQNGNACDIANVNTITASLQSALNNDGWSGSRYTEFSAWPQDFWEGCSTAYGFGDDSTYGDSSTLSVFAGHGNSHLLAFSSTGNGSFNGGPSCNVDMTANMRLGNMAGGQAAFGMWLVCDAVQSSELGSNMWQSLRQQAGWQNSISIGDDEPRDFYNATWSKTNANAWLDQMSSGGRDAIIATFSSDSLDDCWNVHNSAQLRGDVYNFPRNNGATCEGGQPSYYYCYQRRQN